MLEFMTHYAMPQQCEDRVRVWRWPWSCPDFADTFSPEKESEMPIPKPPYPAAFRQQMVELVRAGRGISELAREFGCNASSIHAWVKAAGGLDGSGATSVDAPLRFKQKKPAVCRLFYGC